MFLAVVSLCSTLPSVLLDFVGSVYVNFRPVRVCVVRYWFVMVSVLADSVQALMNLCVCGEIVVVSTLSVGLCCITTVRSPFCVCF